MDLRSLNTFIQTAELGSFTKAAEKLGFSQPTVSFQIKQMERELGVQLFDRIGHTVSLTVAGREALAYAQQICRLTHEMSAGESAEREPEGVIRLAMADSLCAPLIIRRFAEFRRQYPHIELHITTAGTDEMFRLLDHNEVDLVCTLDNHIYNTTYVIAAEEKMGVHFVCSARDPLAAKNGLTVGELLSQPFLLTEKGMSYRRLLDEQLARASREIRPVLEIGSADLICELVQEGAGVSFLPDYVTEAAVADGTLTRLSVVGVEVELWKQLLYHRDKWLSPAMHTVIRYLSQLVLK